MSHHRLDLLNSLRSTICPACGGKKKARQTLCLRDYRRLPRDMQRATYNRFGDGYEEAFDAAMKHLGVTEPTWPPEGAPR